MSLLQCPNKNIKTINLSFRLEIHLWTSRDGYFTYFDIVVINKNLWLDTCLTLFKLVLCHGMHRDWTNKSVAILEAQRAYIGMKWIKVQHIRIDYESTTATEHCVLYLCFQLIFWSSPGREDYFRTMSPFALGNNC